MRDVLGLVGFFVYIACIVGVAAAVTWVVVKVSPSQKPAEQRETRD